MGDRREEIIAATLELAAENGLGTVSMQQIADKVGITKASLYNHFSSRDEIVVAMYERLRRASREKATIGETDFDRLTGDLSLRDILSEAVGSYIDMVSEPRMLLFYRIIMSERTIHREAAEIMVQETKTMINTTKALFYALQVKGIADFGNVDMAAFSFAMAVHAIIEYTFDLKQAGLEANGDMMRDYIDAFSRLYAVGQGNDSNGQEADAPETGNVGLRLRDPERRVLSDARRHRRRELPGLSVDEAGRERSDGAGRPVLCDCPWAIRHPWDIHRDLLRVSLRDADERAKEPEDWDLPVYGDARGLGDRVFAVPALRKRL